MKKGKPTVRTDPAAGNPDDWERTQIEVARPTSVMISVRIPSNLVVDLESYASDRSLTLSDAIRLAVERFVSGSLPVHSFAVLGTIEASSLKLVGPTVMVNAVTSGTRPLWTKLPPNFESRTGAPLS